MSAFQSRTRQAPDPRVRIAIAVAALALVLAAPSPAAALTVAAVATAALVRSRQLRWGILAPVILLGGPAAALAAWLTPGAPAFALSAGGLPLALSRPGLHRAALLLARVLASSLVVRWLASGLRIAEVAAALGSYGVPVSILDLLLLADRQRHTLRESFDTVRSAQALRLGYRGTRRSIASASTLMGTVTCRALEQATTTAQAMQLRGDRGLQPLPPLRLGRAEALLALVAGVTLAAGAALSWSGPWR